VFWCQLNFAFGKHIRSRSVWAVQVVEGFGRVLDYETKEEVQEAIFNEVHCKWYNLAEDAPIWKGALWGKFGYISTSPTAQSILDEAYVLPPDIDEATKELFVEKLSHRDYFTRTLATALEEGEGGHIFIPVWPALWSLYCGSRL
jgi:hypothetical protein